MLVVADIYLFCVVLPLDPQGFDPVASGDFHLLHRDLGIPMGSWAPVEPSGMVLPSILDPEALDGSYVLIKPRSRELRVSSHPGGSAHLDLAEISPHHQNNYELDA